MKLHFTKTNGLVDETIDRLMKTAEGIQRPEYVREMIIAALKAGQEDDKRADLKLMNTTLKEMRFTVQGLRPLPECAQGNGLRFRADKAG